MNNLGIHSLIARALFAGLRVPVCASGAKPRDDKLITEPLCPSSAPEPATSAAAENTPGSSAEDYLHAVGSRRRCDGREILRGMLSDSGEDNLYRALCRRHERLRRPPPNLLRNETRADL
ncbi:MAG: hypothetical protein LBS99_01920 [Clostridiales bacterium]|jgi:hypothetical protein|nr:hypothetical protein [Clostridiales bacterium]